MSTKVDADISRVETALGVGGNVELVPILIPMNTYRMLLDAGRSLGLSVSDVMARSIELFLQPKQDMKDNTDTHQAEPRKVDFRRPKK